MTDKALRQALCQPTVSASRRLPSNFAHTTMQRIAREQKRRERRERVVAFGCVAGCAVLGIVVMGLFYGDALVAALTSMIRHVEGVAVVPAMAFCAVFFALLNHYLRRRFAVG